MGRSLVDQGILSGTYNALDFSIRLKAFDMRKAAIDWSNVNYTAKKIVLFALSHIDRNKVQIKQTRKAGLPLTRPQLHHVGHEARLALNKCADEEGVSINAIVVSVLEHSSTT
jgi:hypothetical protein